MRKICQIIAAGGLIAGLAAPASASTIIFSTPTGATTGGGPVKAQATFITTAGSLFIRLDNLQANPTDVAQLLSDLLFTVSDPTLIAGSVSSSSGQQVFIGGGGGAALGSTVPTGWQVTPLGTGQFHLNDLCGGACAGPAQLLIGPAGPGSVYTNANGSDRREWTAQPVSERGGPFHDQHRRADRPRHDYGRHVLVWHHSGNATSTAGAALTARRRLSARVPEPASLALARQRSDSAPAFAGGGRVAPRPSVRRPALFVTQGRLMIGAAFRRSRTSQPAPTTRRANEKLVPALPAAI